MERKRTMDITNFAETRGWYSPLAFFGRIFILDLLQTNLGDTVYSLYRVSLAPQTFACF